MEKYKQYQLEQQIKAGIVKSPDKAVELKVEAPLHASASAPPASHIAKNMRAQMDAYRESATARPALSESGPKVEAQQSEAETCKFAQFRGHMATMRTSAAEVSSDLQAAPSDLQKVADTQQDAESDVAYSR